MKGIALLLLTCLFVLLISACSVTKMNSSATVKADIGYIRITGHTDSISVFINDVKQDLVLKNKLALIQIQPGTYKVEVFRDGVSILKQKIIVSMTNTTEVVVP